MSEAYLERSQKSMVEHFCENSLKKSSAIDIQLDSK